MLLLKNGTYIDWQTLEFRQEDILVEEGLNGRLIFNPLPESIPLAKKLDCTGKYITKSFACGHHHVYSALARGMPPPRKNPQNFNEILRYVWWTLDKALDIEMIRSSALVTAMACARSGVTFVIDHHASPFAIEGSLETIADAFEAVGISHLLCYEISDRDGIEKARTGLEETESYLEKRQGLVGLHASFTIGNDTLKHAVGLATKTGSGIHIHVAEALSDQDHCRSHYGRRVVERLADAGVLQFPKTILGHCLLLSEHERGLVAGSPVWVVQNTESNLNNRVGDFKSGGLGSRIMLGTDGMHSDMLRSARAAFFTGQNADSIDYAEAYRRFRNVHHYLSSNYFSGDWQNNLVVLDYPCPTPFNQENFSGHFLFGWDSSQVIHVISNGRMIIQNRDLLTVNEEEVFAESRKQAIRLWDRMSR